MKFSFSHGNFNFNYDDEPQEEKKYGGPKKETLDFIFDRPKTIPEQVAADENEIERQREEIIRNVKEWQ